MTINTAAIRDLLLPGLSKIIAEYDMFPRQWSEIFDKSNSEMALEDMGERYQFVYRHIQIALGFVITRNAIRDNLYRKQFNPSAKALRNSILQTEEVYGASVLNSATDATVVGGDGVSLLSSSHPIDTGVVANTPTVQSQLNE